MQIFNFFRTINKGLNLITLVSILIVISTDLWWSKLPELFAGGDRLLNTLYNLCVGFLVSYIFYIIVVHYKEYKDKKHIASVIFPIIQRILENHKQTNECISKDSGITNFDGLCEQINQKAFSKISYSSYIPEWTNSSALGRCSWITYHEQQIASVKSSLSQIYPLMPHVEPELLEIINKYINNIYFFTVKLVSSMGNLPEDMTNLSGVYQQYSQTMEKLNNYIERQQNKPY